jgi:hypothetical protein
LRSWKRMKKSRGFQPPEAPGERTDLPHRKATGLRLQDPASLPEVFDLTFE